MAYYYVKDDGTATGDAGRYASQQTGSFATLGVSNYYSSIQDAIDNSTTSPVAGDFINVSDLHAFTPTSDITIATILPPFPFIVCVDDSNIDQSRTTGNRFLENPTQGGSVINLDDCFISGGELSVLDDIRIQGQVILHDTKLIIPLSFDRLLLQGANIELDLLVCEIALNHVGAFIRVNGGSKLIMNGGSVTTLTAGVSALFSQGFDSGGATIEFNGVDLEAITGTLFANVGASAEADDIINIRFDMCKLASGVAFTNETFKHLSHRALFTRCSDSSAAAEYQYHLHAFGGDVDDDSTIFRNEDEPFTESNQKISYKIVTNSDASLGSPLWFDFPNPRWAELATASTDTLRLHIASTATLTDKDIYIELSYPDGTNKQTPNFISSAPTTVGGTLDLMASGTTLTTDSGSDWRDGGSALSGHNEYIINVDTSGDVGADTVPVVKVYITKPSVTIQLGSTMEQVA